MKHGKKILCLVLALLLMLSTLAGCSDSNPDTDATEPSGSQTQPTSETAEPTQATEATEPNQTTEATEPIKETEPAHTHSWNAATCTAAKTCKTCGATDGAANGHSWNAATCTAPKTCKTCGATDGAANGHSWNAATCTAPQTCKTCGATDGAANGHSWNAATCTAPKTCKTCGTTEGNNADHNYVDGTCSLCGKSIYQNPAQVAWDTEYAFYIKGDYYTNKYSILLTSDGYGYTKTAGYQENSSSSFLIGGVPMSSVGAAQGDIQWEIDGNFIIVREMYNPAIFAKFALLPNGNLVVIQGDEIGNYSVGQELSADPNNQIIVQ